MIFIPVLANAETVEIDGIWYNLFPDGQVAQVTKNPSDDIYTESYSGNVVIPASVTYNDTNYSVTSIGNYSFFKCNHLTSIAIPNSMIFIGNFAFLGCSGLTSVTIPNSLTSIGLNAFEDCTGLTSITIPNSLTSIISYAFSGCIGLTSISIPNSVTSIGTGAFNCCSNLISITIPNNVTYIYYNAFDGCSGLTSLTIGSGVISIKKKAFGYCEKLTDVYCLAEKLSIVDPDGPWADPDIDGLYTDTDAFGNSNLQAMTLHVPAASIKAYRSIEPWSHFGNIVALTDDDLSPTGIQSLKEDSPNYPVGNYSLDGKRLYKEQQGLNIIRMSDGTSKKVVLK